MYGRNKQTAKMGFGKVSMASEMVQGITYIFQIVNKGENVWGLISD